MFPSRSLSVSGFKLFGSNVWAGYRYKPNFISLHVDLQLSPSVCSRCFLLSSVCYFPSLLSIRWMKLWVLTSGSSSDFTWLVEDASVSKVERTNWNWPKSKLVHPLLSTSIRYNLLRISFRKRIFQKKRYVDHLIQNDKLLFATVTSMQMWVWVSADLGEKTEPRVPCPPLFISMVQGPHFQWKCQVLE